MAQTYSPSSDFENVCGFIVGTEKGIAFNFF